MSTGNDDGNVVELPVKPIDLHRKDDVPFELVVNNTGRYCGHGKRIVDRYQRSVTCGHCNAPLDSFDVLLEISQQRERFSYSLASMRKDIKAAEARVGLLKRLEHNATARAKRRGIKASRYHFDALLAYARSKTYAELTEEEFEAMLTHRTPDDMLKAAVAALDSGAMGAAIALARRGIDELEAAAEVVAAERRAGAAQ
jgi:hypothetical protein